MSRQTTYESSKLEDEKIGKLLFNLSLPASIAMMVNGLYNLIVTIFMDCII